MIHARTFSIAHGVTTCLTLDPINIEHLETLTVNVGCGSAAAGVIHTLLEVSNEKSTQAQDWIAINTAAYPYPSAVASAAMGAMGSTTMFVNTYKWLRITLKTCATCSLNHVKTHVAGSTRSRIRGVGHTVSDF